MQDHPRSPIESHQFVQQPLQTFILIGAFNPQRLDFYGNRPGGQIEQREGGVGRSPKSKSTININTEDHRSRICPPGNRESVAN
jgi:hypothetical protein